MKETPLALVSILAIMKENDNYEDFNRAIDNLYLLLRDFKQNNNDDYLAMKSRRTKNIS